MQHIIFEPNSCTLLDSGNILMVNDIIKKPVNKPHACENASRECFLWLCAGIIRTRAFVEQKA